MAAALHRTLSAHNINGPLVLVGHSLGGDVAITYAHQYPATVRSVVLMDATPAGFSTEAASVIPASATAGAASVRAQGVSLEWPKLVPHTKVQSVPGTGHYIYQDAPTVVSRIILTEVNPPKA
jgi:pimeloyl-ACP methyl ester carboxylesterase